MKRFRVVLARLAISALAVTGLVGVSAAPAHAGDVLVTHMYGANHPHYDLGYGIFCPDNMACNDENGNFLGELGPFIYVKDLYCDGDNGIIAALHYWHHSEWLQTDLASVRGCGKTNMNMAGTVPHGASVRLRVCKLTASGAWKDCYDKYTAND